MITSNIIQHTMTTNILLYGIVYVSYMDIVWGRGGRLQSAWCSGAVQSRCTLLKPPEELPLAYGTSSIQQPAEQGIEYRVVAMQVRTSERQPVGQGNCGGVGCAAWRAERVCPCSGRPPLTQPACSLLLRHWHGLCAPSQAPPPKLVGVRRCHDAWSPVLPATRRKHRPRLSAPSSTAQAVTHVPCRIYSIV
jgi:hypothetical protein